MAQYEILRSLDRGGMAEVFLARLVGVEGFEKRVVLKRVLPHLSGDARFLQRFIDEARVAAALSHPNIVQIFELGEQHGQYFIAMEHVDGRNLKDVAKRLFTREERVPVDAAVRIGVAVLDALHYAHTRSDDSGRPLQLVHRDVSPSNVLVSFEGVVKLIDFGIARHAERLERTTPGTVVGKAGYMAPEQMRGERVDARTDVFACAATLFHVVTGMLPFPGVGVSAVMHAVNDGERRAYDEVRDVLDEELFALLSKGYADEPGDRYPSALEMQAALERYAVTRGVSSSTAALGDFMRRTFAGADDDDSGAADPETQSRMITLGGAAFTQVATKEETPHASQPPVTVTRERVGARTWTAVGVVVALMIALGAGAAWLATRGDDEVVTATATVPATATATATETATETATATATEAATATETVTEAVTATATETATETATVTATGAATATATAAETVTEAARATEPPRRRGRSRVSRQRVERTAERVQEGPASLTLDSDPWAEVSINGWKAGLTPLNAVELPAGRHTLYLVNPERKLERKLTVTLRAGESRRMKVRLE